MVTFKENSFVIEIPAEMGVIEEWDFTYKQLIQLMQCVDRKLTDDNFESILNLLQCMMPNLSGINQIVAN